MSTGNWRKFLENKNQVSITWLLQNIKLSFLVNYVAIISNRVDSSKIPKQIVTPFAESFFLPRALVFIGLLSRTLASRHEEKVSVEKSMRSFSVFGLGPQLIHLDTKAAVVFIIKIFLGTDWRRGKLTEDVSYRLSRRVTALPCFLLAVLSRDFAFFFFFQTEYCFLVK